MCARVRTHTPHLGEMGLLRLPVWRGLGEVCLVPSQHLEKGAGAGCGHITMSSPRDMVPERDGYCELGDNSLKNDYPI